MAAVACFAWLGIASRASAQALIPEPLRLAQSSELRADWQQATNQYEALLRKDRLNPELRAGYLRSLRHLQLTRRHRDPAYEAILQQLPPSQALDVYHQVLLIVPVAYVDPYRAGLADLFSNGVQELLYALDNTGFRKHHLPTDVAADGLKEFRNRLLRLRDRRPGPTDRDQAREWLLNVGQWAEELQLASRKGFLTAVVMEFACGACNALDEYSLFLTPGTLANEALGIDVPVSVGVEVVTVDGQVTISRVYPRGPAADAQLAIHDRILRINGQIVAGLTPEMVLERLRGDANTAIELEILASGQAMPEKITLMRRATPTPTVDHRLLTDGMEMMAESVGYLRIASFQQSTLQEVKEALAQLQTQGARAIVLDLRGNGGGLFESAVKVAELFLPEGQLIVKGESPVRAFNRPFAVEGGNPLTLPVAVLVDGETASAAEVVVGALKDHNRARLFGQPTFGKGLIQCIVPVTRPGSAGRMATALKITVARFLTPGKQPVEPGGILPHEVTEAVGDTPVNAARFYLLGVLRATPLR